MSSKYTQNSIINAMECFADKVNKGELAAAVQKIAELEGKVKELELDIKLREHDHLGNLPNF